MGFLDSLLGNNSEDKEAERLARDATGIYSNIAAPTYNSPVYRPYVDTGSYDPTMVDNQTIDGGEDVQYTNAEASLAGPTAMEGVSTDPRLADSQYASLGALDEIIQGGGLNAQDKAALNKVQTDVSAADRGRRDAILQNSAARGMGGGGNELLAQLTSGQAASDRQNQSSMDVAGMAQQRALDAIMQSGQLAGNMRGQEFGEKSDVAKAKDAINTFNAGLGTQNTQFNAANALQNAQTNRAANAATSMNQAGLNQQAGMTNAAAKNDAARYGAVNKQDVSNNTINSQNNQVDARNALKGQALQDQLAIAAGKSGQINNLSNVLQQKADRKTKAAGGLVSGAIGAGAAYYGGGK